VFEDTYIHTYIQTHTHTHQCVPTLRTAHHHTHKLTNPINRNDYVIMHVPVHETIVLGRPPVG